MQQAGLNPLQGPEIQAHCYQVSLEMKAELNQQNNNYNLNEKKKKSKWDLMWRLQAVATSRRI